MEEIEIRLDDVIECITVVRRSFELWQPVVTPTGVGFIVGYRFEIEFESAGDAWFYTVREIRDYGFEEPEWSESRLKPKDSNS